MTPQLRRLVVDFKPEGVQLRTLYRRKAGPGPGTKARVREVAELARVGLEHALDALDSSAVVDLGTSGFETREDVLGLPVASSDAAKRVKGGASSR
jgi:hypothetical protein